MNERPMYAIRRPVARAAARTAVSEQHRGLLPLLILALALASILAAGRALAGERTVVSLRDFVPVELRSAGLSLKSDATLKIRALGNGAESKMLTETGMFAYGWIIDASTRQEVWTMSLRNTDKVKKGREFEGTIDLPRGDYEIYYAAFAYGSSSWFNNWYVNIDRRESTTGRDPSKKRGVFSWFEGFFGENGERDWKEAAREWGIDIILDNSVSYTTFTPPLERKHVVFRATEAGERARARTGLAVKRQVELGVYCLGEIVSNHEGADYAWIVDRKTRRRIWEMTRRNSAHAGGAKKNYVYDGTVRLDPGEYVVTYITDDSHSAPDWNAAPPSDPLNYGITLYLVNPNDAGSVSLSSPEEREETLISLTGVRDDEFRSSTFTLKKESSLRVYALGERMYSRAAMADHGWIINARTREKVWSMDPDKTDHAGGDPKNRVADEIITLPAGTYTVYYSTDDSHAFEEWNSDAPIDAERWGITIFAGPENFSRSNFATGGDVTETGVIAQIVRVKDSENRQAAFTLKERTKIRIYAVGEGLNHEMYDYGWIEKTDGRQIPWEMTYPMTFHAGGAKKNRVVNTTIVLDAGSYILRFKSDDSHSFNNWNTSPPEDPTMWGITLYAEE